MKNPITEMREDLVEIFDEEYSMRGLITPDFTAIKMAEKGYKKQNEWGKWKTVKDDPFVRNYRCSACDKETIAKFSFCPNCGASMNGGEI